jgi:hypothetical protein
MIDATRPARQPRGSRRVILIAHPENQLFGTRFRHPGAVLEIGRSQEAQISLPGAVALSAHARLQFTVAGSLEDWGGTDLRQRPGGKGSISRAAIVRSGNSFKFLRGATSSTPITRRSTRWWCATPDRVHSRRKFVGGVARWPRRSSRPAAVRDPIDIDLSRR